MTSDPIRFLDDPNAAIELREFMLGQARPDALPRGQRALVERRIAASVLALPVSMKLGGLLSHGSTTVGGSVSSSAGAGSAGAGSAGAGSLVGGASVGGSVTSSAAVSGGAASGLAGAAGASMAPAAMGSAAVGSAAVGSATVGGAAVGGAAFGTGLTLAGAKGVAAGVAGALSVTKGAAVLGVALATGAGATYVAQEGLPTRAQVVVEEGRHSGMQTVRAETLRANLQRAGARGARAAAATGAPVQAAAEGAPRRGVAASGPDEGALLEGVGADKLHCAGEGCGSSSHSGSKNPRSTTRDPSTEGGALSLEDLEDVQHAGASTANRSSSSSELQVVPGLAARPEPEAPAASVPAGTSPSSERLQEEVELLRRAQQLLRVDRTLAAEALERYDAKFPDGAMRAEYDVLRRRLVSSTKP